MLLKDLHIKETKKKITVMSFTGKYPEEIKVKA